MRKNMPYMVLDITKKPGDPNAVKTGDMLLAENAKLREALTKILNLTNSLDEDCAVDPVEIRDIAKAALAATETKGGKDGNE